MMKLRITFILFQISMIIFICAYGQQTAEDCFKKGIELSTPGKCEEAIKALDESIQIDPKNADALIYKGNALYNLGNCNDAIEAYDKAIKIEPKLEDAWSMKVFILEALGRNKEAYSTRVSANKHHINISKLDIGSYCLRPPKL